MKEIEDDFEYCHHCGGFVDYSQCKVLLVSPEIYQYHCEKCFKAVIKKRLNVKERINV